VKGFRISWSVSSDLRFHLSGLRLLSHRPHRSFTFLFTAHSPSPLLSTPPAHTIAISIPSRSFSAQKILITFSATSSNPLTPLLPPPASLFVGGLEATELERCLFEGCVADGSFHAEEKIMGVRYTFWIFLITSTAPYRIKYLVYIPAAGISAPWVPHVTQSQS
jgi:hypothetical protein